MRCAGRGLLDGGGVLDILPAEPAGWGALAAPEPAALARAVEAVLQEPDRMAEAQARGTEWRCRLSPEAVAAACEGWYREALHG